MSETNVEIIRRIVDLFNEGGIQAAAPHFDPDVEFREPPEQPGPRVARGARETSEMFAAFDAAWEEHRSEPEEIRALGAEQVLLLSIEHFRGRDGIEVTHPAGSIFTLREGKVVLWQAYWDRETALKAAATSV
jgi:ketosteroid isomerase-like protein